MAFLRFFILLLPMLALAQTEIVAGLPVLEQELKADAFLGRDSYGNLYAIRSDAFLKIEKNRTLEYRNVSGGRIARADLTNPLLIVLFYADFNMVVLLDNQLNEVRRIDFNTMTNPIIVQAAGLASQNRLWIFDSISLKILLYDLTRNSVKPVSVPLANGIRDYWSDYNHFQWVDTEGNRMAIDLFGKTKNLGKLPAYESVQLLLDGSALLLIEGRLHIVKPYSEQLIEVKGVENSFKKFYFDDQFLTIFTDRGITNYKINLP